MKPMSSSRLTDGDGIYAPAVEADGIAIGDASGYAASRSTETF